MDLEVVQTVIQAGILITVVYIAKTTGGKTGPGPAGAQSTGDTTEDPDNTNS